MTLQRNDAPRSVRLRLEKSREIYILGASGVIGSELISSLLELGVGFRSVGRSKTDHHFLDLAANQFDALEELRQGDIVIILAAISSPDTCERNYDEAAQINVTATSTVISKALALDCYVMFFSSDTVFGSSPSPCFEMSSLQPLGAYGHMKAAVEEKFRHFNNFFIMRLSYVMSPRDPFVEYLRNCITKKASAEIFHPFKRCMIDIQDVLALTLKFLASPSTFPNVMNACGSTLISRLEIAQTAQVSAGLKYRVSNPPPQFFIGRAKEIDLRSALIENVIRRPRLGVLKRVPNYLAAEQPQ